MVRIICILILLITTSVHAQERDPSYVIELEQIEEASDEAKLRNSSTELKNILDKSGFILTPSAKDSAFVFSISDTNLDFSDIIPAQSKTNSTLLRINSDSPSSYQIIASIIQPFQSSLEETIPQTSCNTSSPCTPLSPNQWTDKDAYGWGFQLHGPDVKVKSPDETYFRIFDEKKQLILSENSQLTGESSTKLSIKVQTSPEQKEGNYTGVVKIIAIPKL